MKKPLIRICQRYLIPKIIASIYYLIRYNCIVSARAKVQLSKNISFGSKTAVKSFSVIQTHGGKISFGINCAIGSFDHISSVDANIVIGNNVRIGSGVTIIGSSRKFKKKDLLIVEQGYEHKGINIGNDVMIGSGSIILSGSNIGNGVVIGAGSVVNKNIPSYSIIAGVPAKIIGKRK
jgi:acetyltransferase-like isoleucine patch superfamily enzyme